MTINGAARILPLLFLAVAPALHATSPLDSSIIGMFPNDVSEFGYADLNQAREFSWFPQFEAQLVPVSLYGFEHFLEAAQMQQTSSIDQVAWAGVTRPSVNSDRSVSGSGQLVGVAVGHFDRDAIQSFLKSRKVPAVQVGGNTVYSSGTGPGTSDIFFALIDNETIAFGPLEPLVRILEIRGGEDENLLANETMMTLIDEANGGGIFWGVFDSVGAGRAIQQLIPEAAKFAAANDLFGKMKGILITVKASSDLELDFQGTCASPNDAMLLSQLLQAGVLYRQYQSRQSNPELAKILESVSIASSGIHLELSLTLTDEEMLSLIEHNTFNLSLESDDGIA